ncbi:hypothetical protein ULF88_16685 [Halopseudomonas pachastrellae]|nr:hypothetical protein [Halopseudomonas pachastrellae]
MLSDLTQWLGAHTQWLGVAIFLVSLTESLAVAGLVVPGVFLLFAFAALAASADMPLLEAIAWRSAARSLVICSALLWGAGFIRIPPPVAVSPPPAMDRPRRAFFPALWLGQRGAGPLHRAYPPHHPAGCRHVRHARLALYRHQPAISTGLGPGLPDTRLLSGTGRALGGTAAVLASALSIAVGAVIVVGGSLYLLRLQRRWSALAAAAVCLLALLVLSANQSALAIFSDTLVSSRQFLQLPGSERLALLHPSLLLVTLPIAALLLLLRQWGAVSLLLLTLAFALLLDWIIGLSLIAATSSLVLAVLGALLVICNRERPFWWRASWALPAAVPGPVAG